MSQPRLKIAIVGGYGTFGGRLAHLLADEAGLDIVVAGRSLAKAQAFCAGMQAQARLIPAHFDRDGDVLAQLRRLGPALVVDASGPFQNYGAKPFRVVEAAIELGMNYIDLADSSDFVRAIGQFDTAARRAGVFALAGVSSVPVLNFAAARALAVGLASVERLSGGIAPSPHVQVGLNVVRAIAATCGKPLKLWRNGRVSRAFGLTEARRFTICPPGCLPLPSLRFSLVDTPDLTLAAEAWPNLREVWMGAGTRPQALLRLLGGLAWLVRLRLVPTLAPLASLFHRAGKILRWGEDRGGMFVEVAGTRADGGIVVRAWHLLAQGDNGPFIPAIPAACLVQRMLAGKSPAPGARAATREHELADFAAIFAGKGIVTGMHQSPGHGSLYRRILGDAFSDLPEPLQRLHALEGSMSVTGRALVERGANPLARLVAGLAGFPKAGADVPVKVVFTSRPDGSEIWSRTFDGKTFASIQSAGTGRWQRLVCERFGPFSVALALVRDAGSLRVIVRHWRFLRLPLPRWLAPGGDIFEFAENGRFCFHVEIAHPLTGLIVRYRGWLVADAEAG